MSLFDTPPEPEPDPRSEPIPAPVDFVADVERARCEGWRGDLRLFALEARGFEWEKEGLHLIAETENNLRALEDARGGTDTPARVILFTGHMVDTSGKPKDRARFPPTVGAEARACALIEAAVRKAAFGNEGITLGLAGGACGGDIIFHEVCDRLGLPTRVYLALPQAEFEATSVHRAGPKWVERYRSLCLRVGPRVLQQSHALPRWLAGKPDYDVWQRSNLWMMCNALATDARQLTLIALINVERAPEGPGGTHHLIEQARVWGFESIELDARELLAE